LKATRRECRWSPISARGGTIGSLAVLLLAAVAPLSASGAPPRGVVVKVLAAGATESTLRAVVAEFEAHGRRRLQLTFGGVGQLRDRIVSGQAADLVIATPVILEQLGEKELLRPGSRVDLGRVGGGIAVRAGEPRPPVGSPEELKQALLGADEIYFPDPATTTAGAHLLAVAEQLGIGADVRRKGRTAPGGKQAMEHMARARGRTIGVTQISEILSVEDVVLVGPYPEPLQKTTTYAGVVLARAAQPAAAGEFLRFLASPAVRARFRKAGFETD
jgi:molybdate transport system substrate-binding protein